MWVCGPTFGAVRPLILPPPHISAPQAALAAAGSVLQLMAVPGGAVGLPHTLGAVQLLDAGAVGRLKAANGSGGALLLRLPRVAHGYGPMAAP